MRLFLKNSLFFIVPILISFFIIELLTRNSNSIYKHKWEGFIAEAENIEVLILGNSHAADGIDPTQFDLKAYNMAFGSQSLYFDEAITMKNLNKMKNLKYVLISVDYHTLYSDHNELRDIYYHYYYGIDYKDTNYWKEDISMLLEYGLRNSVKLHILNPTYIFKNGYSGSYKETNYESLTREKGRERVEMFKLNRGVNMQIVNRLNNFVEILKNNNITPIIITLPCHKNYRDFLDKKIIEENLKNINNLCLKYNIRYYNYLNEPLPDSLFYNVDHLNFKGAKFFSLELNRLINNMK